MKRLKLYNPLTEDFHVTYDTNGDGHPLSYTLHAQEIEEFDEPVAIHIKEHLGYKYAMMIKGKRVYEDALKDALAKIEV